MLTEQAIDATAHTEETYLTNTLHLRQRIILDAFYRVEGRHASGSTMRLVSMHYGFNGALHLRSDSHLLGFRVYKHYQFLSSSGAAMLRSPPPLPPVSPIEKKEETDAIGKILGEAIME